MNDLVKELATETSSKIAIEDLNSDISHYYPTGNVPLDLQLSGGKGVPSGRLIELYGSNSAGKSTMALEFSKAFTKYWKSQETPCVVLWIESESVFDRLRAKFVGCDIADFIVAETDIVEDGFGKMRTIIKKAQHKGLKVFIIWDTIGATKTRNEKEKGAFSGGMGEKPRVIWSELRSLMGLLGETGTTLVLVNQVYDGFGGGVVSNGGNGIRFFSSIRLQINHKEDITNITMSGKETVSAIVSNLFSKKNKITLPRLSVQLYINTEKGFDNFQTLFLYCSQNKIFDVKGSWKKLVYNGEEHSFQNFNQFKKLMEIPEVRELLEYKVYVSFVEISPLMKVKLLDQIWGYEENIFGKKVTTITQEENELAQLVSKKLKETDGEMASPEEETIEIQPSE